MAKNNSLFLQLQGTFDEVVYVNSKTYGNHVRKPRGTYKPAPVNAVLQSNANKAKTINAAAKRLHDLLNGVYKPFKKSNTWSNILSRMRSCGCTEFYDLLASVKGLELHEDYPLQRFHVLIVPQIKTAKKQLTIAWKNGFVNSLRTEEFKMEWSVLFFGDRVEKDSCVIAEPKVIASSAASVADDSCVIDIPKGVKYYVACLKMVKGKGGRFEDYLKNTGARVVEVGRV